MSFHCVALLLSALRLLASASGPCCQACDSGKEKYYSIPDTTDPNAECGECCLQPSRYSFWKLFEPKLLKGDCASLGYTQYKSTETDGFPPLAVTNDRYVKAASPAQVCPEKLEAIYADMHDGDKKQITISGKSLTIKPSGSNQTWVVNANFNVESCSAIVDFNVPGKPGPPPVNLTATLWYSYSSQNERKSEYEFTDPTGTLPAGPLNRWIELGHETTATPSPCPTAWKAVYSDMHDGDMKEITISGTSLTIKPSGNNQTWVVKSQVDPKSCSAAIDFNVPGKPGPPPVNLTAALLTTIVPKDQAMRITEFEFTDPSGTLAAADFPLNHWVEIKKEHVDGTMVV